MTLKSFSLLTNPSVFPSFFPAAHSVHPVQDTVRSILVLLFMVDHRL
jgi:hypothetical protein